MDPAFVPMALVILVVVVGGFATAGRKRREREALLAAARALDADWIPAAFPSSVTGFHGKAHGLDVVVRAYTRSTGKNAHRRLHITVSGVPAGLAFRKQGLLDDAWQAVAGADHQVGDPAFDAEIVVGGEALASRLALDAETRDLLRRAVALGAKVDGGKAEIDVAVRVQEADWVLARVDVLARLVERLRGTRADLATRLVALAADPSPLMRREALLELHARAPDRAREVAEKHRSDPDASVRAVAADLLGDLPMLRRVLAAAVDPDALVRAARALGLHHDTGAEPALLSQAAHADARVRVAVAEALAEVGTVRAVETLLPLTKGIFADGDARSAAAAAIAAIQSRIGDAAAGRVAVVDEAGGRVAVADGGKVGIVEGTKKG